MTSLTFLNDLCCESVGTGAWSGARWAPPAGAGSMPPRGGEGGSATMRTAGGDGGSAAMRTAGLTGAGAGVGAGAASPLLATQVPHWNPPPGNSSVDRIWPQILHLRYAGIAVGQQVDGEGGPTSTTHGPLFSSYICVLLSPRKHNKPSKNAAALDAACIWRTYSGNWVEAH